MTMLRRFNSTALEEMERMLSEFNPDDYAANGRSRGTASSSDHPLRRCVTT